jgi:hypothetical protein
METTHSENQISRQTQIMPAYEMVKRNILFKWFDIQEEYEKYLRITSHDKEYRPQTISSMILALYRTMVRVKFENYREKGKNENPFKLFIKDMDEYSVKGIPKEKVHEVIQTFSLFFEKIKLTDISFEKKPWERSFEDSFGA